jgi:DNA-binding NtrC family response regulator
MPYHRFRLGEQVISTRRLALEALRAVGLDAIGFSDPMDALAAIEADSRVRVLVTRINFGEGKLNGLALSRMLLVKRRAVKTVFIARPEYAHLADGLGEFLSRPLNPHHLVDVVARLHLPKTADAQPRRMLIG